MNDVEDTYVVQDLKGDRVFGRFSCQKAAMEWVSDVLESTKGFFFLSALNDLQAECNPHVWGMSEEERKKNEVFPDKFRMPLAIINLVLKEHGLKIAHQ